MTRQELIEESTAILEAEDLYELQDNFCSLGISFKYRMTEGELGWLDFVRGKYSIADWITENLDGDILTFDDVESMSQALDDDCRGWGKATCLSDETALQKLFFWTYIETEEVE